MLANAWHSEAEQCFTRSGRAGSTLEMDSGHKNKKICLYRKSLRSFLRILCVVDDSIYARKGTRSAFGDLDRN